MKLRTLLSVIGFKLEWEVRGGWGGREGLGSEREAGEGEWGGE